MQLLVSSTLTVVEGPCPPDLFEALDEALSFRDPDAFHDPRFKAHVWDGRIRLLGAVRALGGRRAPAFPTGLLGRALDALAARGATPTQVPIGRPAPTPLEASAGRLRGLTLRPDQVEALGAALGRTPPRGLLALATNYGKTALLAAVLTHYPQARALVLAPGQDTYQNLVSEFTRYGLDPGYWTGGGRRQLRRITVATAPAFALALRRPEVLAWLREVDVLLVDECHTITQRTWFPIFERCPAPVRFGVSGTVRESKKRLILEAHFGPIFHEVREREMSDAGLSAQPCILMPKVGGLVTSAFGYGSTPRYRDEADTVGAMVAGTYETGVVANPQREALLVECLRWARARALQTLILFYSRQHGQLLVEAFERAGLGPLALVHGDHPPAAREAVKQAFTGGALPTIVGSNIFATGVNLPAVQVFVNAAAWKAEGITAQKLGRGLRLKPFEGMAQKLVVLDPYDFATDLLERHSKARAQAYRKRGYLVSIGQLRDLLPQADAYLIAPSPR